MATGLRVWSTTAASNSNADTSVNWAEGQAPSSINDSARAVMASMAKWRDDNNGTLSTTGSSAAFTVTSNQGSTANLDGDTVVVQFHASADAAATLAKDSNTAAKIQLIAGTNLTGGEIPSGSVHRMRYSSGSTAWVVEGRKSIIASDISAGFITNSMVADATLTSTKLVDSTIATTKIADAAVTYAKIQNVAAISIVSNMTTSAAVPTGNTFSQIGPIYHLKEQQTQNTSSSNAPTSGAWRTVVLNTEHVKDISGASLSSNVLSLPAGTYRANASMALGQNNANHVQLRLRNTSDSATLIVGQSRLRGSSFYAEDAAAVVLFGTFTISATKNVELQIQVDSNMSACTGANFDTECYVDLILTKVA